MHTKVGIFFFNRVKFYDSIWLAGIVPIVAAGNSGANACNYSPASTTVALTIAASDSSDRIAGFSNQGSCVDMSGPGVNINSITTCSGGSVDCLGLGWSGTSMATPIVAGAAALVWAKEAATLTTAAKVVSRMRGLGTTGVLSNLKSRTPNLLVYDGL